MLASLIGFRSFGTLVLNTNGSLRTFISGNVWPQAEEVARQGRLQKMKAASYIGFAITGGGSPVTPTHMFDECIYLISTHCSFLQVALKEHEVTWVPPA